ncbi:hypothetical protein F2Q69_00011674 [Brassica cretica]|uniref:TIR domain-containing protein n=1 Tax=Brassica cretica TaxID=69181 RepID=A0A8S9QQT6_BRACR|nr:hypothetical protein F2Q69_00011674 [Brassica cretica]
MMKTGAVSDPRSRLMWEIFLSSQETEATVSRIVSIKHSSRHISGSHWFLEELAKFCDLRSSLGRPILPIFYKVDPWHFRKQSPFEKYIEEHAKRFSEEEIQRWRGAMNVVGQICGFFYRYMNKDSIIFILHH